MTTSFAVNGKHFIKCFLMAFIPCVAGLSLRHHGSRVVRVEVCNLGGMTPANDPNDDRIQVDLSSDGPSFTAVTGETGAGKSLILAKAASLVCGGKVSPSILGLDAASARENNKPISVGIEFHLKEPHLSLVNKILEYNKINLHMREGSSLYCSRTITLRPPKTSKSNKFRLKSICSVNGQTVTLQALSSITSPLLAVVDGSIAASGLENGQVRRAIIDSSIPTDLFQMLEVKKDSYKACRKEREIAQNRLQQSVLPAGFSRESEADQKLLKHWINELDAFEARVARFCQSLEDISSDEETRAREKSGISSLCAEVTRTQWMDSDTSDSKQFSSGMHTNLSRLRDELRNVDNQLLAAKNALDALTMLSSNESVLTAIEKARRFTYDASQGSDNNAVVDAAEKCHDLLNVIEEATNTCARHLEENQSGLIQQLENERALCPISLDAVEEILLNWATLARKHGVPVQALPSCHEALLREKDGNEEALLVEKINQLLKMENETLSEVRQLCQTIYKQRQNAAKRLSQLVSERLPSLGMEYSTFEVNVMSSQDSAMQSHLTWSQFSVLGLDEVEFSLVHTANSNSFEEDKETPHLASLQDVASSGEKARILLAIECAIPGSVATACLQSKLEASTTTTFRPSPVLVLYDEIDAHVGGNAGTALAKMLLEQSSSCQVLAITHSPAVAALSDHHIVVQRQRSTESARHAIVSVRYLNGAQDRIEEIARMASGSLAVAESEAFADALMRDGASIRNATFSFAR